MRVLLDECVPRPFKQQLPEHEVPQLKDALGKVTPGEVVHIET
jgi:hypothetical protein